MKKERIWEIDALRGFMIVCMVFVHFVIGSADDRLIAWPSWLIAVFGRLGVLFVLLSGISATLGKRSFRRGVIVFACGLLLELGSYIAVLLGIFGNNMVIRFGVLHLLGISMMLWPLLRKSSPWVLVIFGAVIIGLGYWFETFYVEPKFLFAIGLIDRTFTSGDFYPIFPQLGFFLVGGAIGKWVYPEKKTLFPKVNADNPVLRFFRFCGRHSLIIYLFHFLFVGAVLALLSLFLH